MIIDKIIKSLLTISVSLTSFSAFSASISLGTANGIRIAVDKTFVPVDIDDYQQYKEVKLKINAIKKISNEFNVGDYGEGVIWIDCKNKARINKAYKFFNSDGSLKEKQINAGDTPSSFLEKNESNSYLHNLCQNISNLNQHQSLTRNSKKNDQYEGFAHIPHNKSPTMSRKEYQQTLYDMNKKISALVSHRSRLHSGRDPENPDIITKVTKENILANTKKDFELTCKKLKLLNQQKKFILDQNFYTKDLDLVPILESLRNERIRVRKKSDSIKEKGGKADICLDM